MKYQIEVNNEGPWIIFSNSLGTDISIWNQQVEYLKKDFRILRYETGGKEAQSISDLGMNVLKLMDELNISQGHFCGISLGGLIGQWLGIHHTSRFLSLVLCNTSPRIANEEVWEKRTLLVREKGLVPIKEASPSRWFTPQFKETQRNKVNKALEGFNHTDPEDYISCCKILKVTDLWEELPKIKVRTLIVAGEFDEVTTVAEAQEMKEAITGAKLEVLPAAHLSNIEAPGFSQLLRNFMIGV